MKKLTLKKLMIGEDSILSFKEKKALLGGVAPCLPDGTCKNKNMTCYMGECLAEPREFEF